MNFENILNEPGVYCIECVTDKRIYIGSSYDVRKRLEDAHFNYLSGNYHPNDHLQNAYNLYGEKFFKVFVLEYCVEEICTDREQYFLDELLFAQEYIKSNHKDKRFLELGFNKNPIAESSRGREVKDSTREIMKDKWKEGSEYFKKQKLTRTPEWNARRVKKGIEAQEKDPTWKDRLRESFEESGSRKKMYKSVISYNRFTGQFVKEYESIISAAEEIGVSKSNLQKVLREEKRYTHDLVFKYKTENYPLQIEPVAQYADIEGRKKAMKKIHANNSKVILCYDLNNKFIKEFANSVEAGNELGIDSSNITSCARGEYMQAGGYSFKYKDYIPRKYNKRQVA